MRSCGEQSGGPRGPAGRPHLGGAFPEACARRPPSDPLKLPAANAPHAGPGARSRIADAELDSRPGCPAPTPRRGAAGGGSGGPAGQEGTDSVGVWSPHQPERPAGLGPGGGRLPSAQVCGAAGPSRGVGAPSRRPLHAAPPPRAAGAPSRGCEGELSCFCSRRAWAATGLEQELRQRPLLPCDKCLTVPAGPAVSSALTHGRCPHRKHPQLLRRARAHTSRVACK